MRSPFSCEADDYTARQTLTGKDVMMRLKHWFTAILGGLAIAGGLSTAEAQSNPFRAAWRPSFDSVVAPVSVRGQSPGGYPPGGMVVPGGYTTMPSGGYAPGAVNVGGFPNVPAGVQPVGGPMGPPPGAHPWPRISPFEHRYSEHRNEGGLWFWRNNNAPRKYFASLSAMLFRLKHPEKGLFGDQTVSSALGPNPLGRPVVPIGTRNAAGERVFANPFKTEGVRAQWGFWDADDTGFEMVGWWASQVRHDFDAFDDTFDPFNPPAFAARGFAVPVNNGTAPTALTFDGSFSLHYRQMAVNANASRLMRSIWEWNEAIKVRPLWGARYTFVREGMFFSGFQFTDSVAPFQTVLDNDISTHLFGPEVGLHTSIGNDVLKITLGTRFILYINHERQRLNGLGWVDVASQGPALGQLPFNEERNSTHVSPAFEQTVHFESHIFRLIPWLNRMKFFRNAKLRGGITYLDIGEVARPGGSVRYNSFPLTPTLKTERSKYSVFAWDVGFLVEY